MYPATSILSGPHPGDAWLFADAGNTRFLVSTNGQMLISDIQRALASVMAQFSRGEFPDAFKHVKVVDYFTRVPVRQTGVWDAATARATMQLASGTPDQIRDGWAEVYRRRFGPALTQFALTAWLNETMMSSRLRSAGASTAVGVTAMIPRGARLPTWGSTLRGLKSPVLIRKL